MQLHAETLADHEWEINPSPTISNPPLGNRSHFHIQILSPCDDGFEFFLRSNVTAAPAHEMRVVTRLAGRHWHPAAAAQDTTVEPVLLQKNRYKPGGAEK
jgi:hypothetical protein